MKPYKQGEYDDDMFTQVFAGSTKTLSKLEKVYTVIYPLVKDTLRGFAPKVNVGRSAHNPEVLFKMLFLQHMQGLSDRMLIEMLYDRISFRRFTGIVKDDDIPDRASLIRFRAEYFRNARPQKLFNKLFKQLRQEGLIVKAGSMIDSSIVESPGKRSGSSKRDKYAKYTKKHGRTYFGYKMHANIDKDSKLIKCVKVTSANVNDSTMFDEVLQPSTTEEVYADKGYASPVREYILENVQKIKSHVMRKSYRGNPLSESNERRNNKISKTRARVEHVFGRIKNEFNLEKTRYFCKYKNEGSLVLIAALFNAKEMIRLHGI